MSDIQKLIASLARSGRRQPTAPPRAVTDIKPISSQLGVGVSKKSSDSSSVTIKGVIKSSYKTEVASAYTIILVTADGAYEAPPGWPANRLYPQEVGTMETNDTIERVNNQYGVIDGAAIYEQKRVHSSIFVQSAGSQEVVMYGIQYEKPLNQFHRAGLNMADMFYQPTIYIEELSGDFSYDTSAFGA